MPLDELIARLEAALKKWIRRPAHPYVELDGKVADDILEQLHRLKGLEK